jgi:farnesyl diphosphate synthase
VRDDLLDVEGESATLGKTAGKDAAQAKPTFPALIGIEATRTRLDALAAGMRDALSALPADTDTSMLAALGRLAIERDR